MTWIRYPGPPLSETWLLVTHAGGVALVQKAAEGWGVYQGRVDINRMVSPRFQLFYATLELAKAAVEEVHLQQTAHDVERALLRGPRD